MSSLLFLRPCLPPGPCPHPRHATRAVRACAASPPAPPTLAIVGLGNPGPQYTHTRHNVGFLLLDLLATRANAPPFSPSKPLRAHVTSAQLPSGGGGGGGGAPSLLLVKPHTFMNASGQTVRALAKSAAADGFSAAQHMLVVVDDIDLPFGAVRARPRGSPGTHNGLKSVAATLGSREFPRLRVGVGAPPNGVPLADYVLEDFSRSELADLNDNILIRAAEMVDKWIDDAIRTPA